MQGLKFPGDYNMCRRLRRTELTKGVIPTLMQTLTDLYLKQLLIILTFNHPLYIHLGVLPVIKVKMFQNEHFMFFLKNDTLCVCVCVCVCVCSVTQSCLTLCDPMDYILLGSSVHGIS